MPKLSLAVMALGLAHSALAVECASTGITIKGDNESLTGCQIDYKSSQKTDWLSLGAVTIENSKNVNLTNNQITAENDEIDSQGPRGLNGLYIYNSSVTLINNNVSVKNGLGNLYALSASNSTLSIDGGSYTSTEKDPFIAGSTIDLRNSTLNVKNANLSASGDSLNIISLENASRVTLENVTLNATNNATIFEPIVEVGKSLNNSTIVVNNSRLTADDTAIGLSWPVVSEREESHLLFTLNNSSLVSPVIIVPVSAFDNEEDSQTTLVEKLELEANNSTLSGTISIQNAITPKSQATYNLKLNDSTWTTSTFTGVDEETNQSFTFTPGVSSLRMNKGHVILSPAQANSGFQTLTINDLSGQGKFTLNSDLASQQADKIHVTNSAEGTFTLAVNDSGNEPNAANGQVTLVQMDKANSAAFSLADRDFVDAGAYRYRLRKEGNDWVLSNLTAEASSQTTPPATSDQAGQPVAPTQPTVPDQPPVTPTQPTSPAQPATPTQPSTPSQPALVSLSEKSNALVSLRQAQLLQVEQNLPSLHHRLGELKATERGNVWLRNENGKQELDGLATAHNSRASGFEQDYHNLQVGADVTLSQGLRVGGFVGQSRANVDFKEEYGTGKIRSQALGAYATWLADNGFYWDNVYKYERLKTESAATDNRRYHANTLSTEIGRIHSLNGSWTITPQIQAAWTKLSAQEDEESLSSLYGRAGVRVAKALQFASGWNLQPYLEANGILSTGKGKVGVNQYEFDVKKSGGRVETALGFNAGLGNHRLGLEASTTQGKNLKQPFALKVAYRYSW
ncbi:hypothetical protein A4G20_02730 [Pasteurellaceae bacterium RH1A]|nr:hypothetical protein A4G20_02730 [Pasteurellaceae bacterium RH1A]